MSKYSDQVRITLLISEKNLAALSVPFQPVDRIRDDRFCALMKFPDGTYRLMVVPGEIPEEAEYKKIRKFHPGAPKGE